MRNLPFVEDILADLRRFAECVEDNNDVNLERSRFDLLTQLGLLARVQRSPARWMMTQAGEDAIAQPTGEPVATVGTVPYGPGWKSLDFHFDLQKLPNGTKLYAVVPFAAAHGEALQYRLLRVGEIIQATDELLRDDCTTWQSMSDGPQLGIGCEWHVGLVPMRRVEPAMRAQGDEGGRA